MPRSVLHILGTAQPEGTGIAQIAASLTRGLKVRGYIVHTYFLGAHGPLVAMLQAVGAHAHVIGLHGRSLGGALRLWRGLHRDRFSIIHQHAGGPLVTRLAGWASGAPIVLHLHGRVRESQCPQPVPIRVRHAAVVIASSFSVAQHVTGATPRVIYAGVPIPDGPRDRSVNPGKRVTIVGTGCRLVPIKGIPNLVRAFGLLQPEFPKARLEIAGDGPERGSILRLVNDLGLQNCVTILGWKSDFASVLANWDIFVLPSLEESFPIAAVEAMAASLPVVASDVGGLREIVQDGETGWLVPAGDPELLAQRLRTLLLNTEDRLRMGFQGQVRARTHFSEDRMVAEIAEIYEELTGATPAGRPNSSDVV
jgi:glycosyltransferase involved in cell wall biosynthesis